MQPTSGHSLRVRLLIVGVALLALFGLFAAIHGVPWRQRVPITRALLTQPSVLSILVATCGGDPAVDEFREDEGKIVVSVVSTRTYGGRGANDCLDSVEVPLGAPLADRAVVDATTLKEIVVEDR